MSEESEKYHKLVRDKIPGMLDKKGISYEKIIADKEEYRGCLLEKLVEEATEFKEAKNEEELADVWEVIDALMKEFQFDHTKIMEIKKKKFDERGGFYQRIILKGEK